MGITTPEVTTTARESSTMLETRIRLARKSAPTLPEPVIATWIDSAVLHSSAGRPWVIAPAEHDPLRGPDGTIAIPRNQMRELRALEATGVAFDRMAIAHELDPERILRFVRHPIPPEGLLVSDGDARALVGQQPLPRSTIRAARRLDAVASRVLLTGGALVAGTVASGGLAAAAMAAIPLLLDPIIFGVLGVSGSPKNGDVAAYFPLVAWDW